LADKNVSNPENNEDVFSDDNIDINKNGENENDVDGRENADNTFDSYDDAFDNIDINNPPDDLFADDDTVNNDESQNANIDSDDGNTDESNDGSTSLVEENEQNIDSEENNGNDGANIEGLVIKRPVLKRKGQEITIDSEDRMIQLAQMGLDYAAKMHDLKPYKKIVSIAKSNGITEEDIQALADAKSGKQEAIRYLANKFGITLESDPFEDEEKANDYQPNVTHDEVQDWFQEFAETNPTDASKVAEAYSQIPDTFKAEVYKPGVFQLFAQSVATGEFEKIYPRAEIIVATSGNTISWLNAYQMAAKELGLIGEKQNGEKPKKQKPSKAAQSVKKSGGGTKRSVKGLDYDSAWDKDTDELEKLIFS